MKKIIDWLMSCGYAEKDAKKEAMTMINRVRYDRTGEVCSMEFAIEQILMDIGSMEDEEDEDDEQMTLEELEEEIAYRDAHMMWDDQFGYLVELLDSMRIK